MVEFRFVRWGPNHDFAVFEVNGRIVYIPFSRLIPNPVCEAYYEHLSDPNLIATLCAEKGSIFGPAAWRHYEHLMLRYGRTDVRERSKEYRFPLSIDFSCVRDLILEGVDTDEAIARCS